MPRHEFRASYDSDADGSETPVEHSFAELDPDFNRDTFSVEQNTDREDSSPENIAESNVEQASSRIESARTEGARLGANAREYTSAKLENGRNYLRANGKVIAQKALEGGKIVAGSVSLGMQGVGDRAKSAWKNLQNRRQRITQRIGDIHAQYQADRARKEEQSLNAHALAAAQAEELRQNRRNELTSIASDELNRLDTVEPGDAETFNAKPENIARDHEDVLDAAKRYKVNEAHEEALGMNKQYDQAYTDQQQWINAANERKDPAWMHAPENFNSVQRQAVEAANREAIDTQHEEALKMQEERQLKEEAEYDKEFDKAEEFLKRYKDNKDADLTNIYREYKNAFPAQESHKQDAYDDAFNVFAGKKLKKAARAAHIKQGREKIKQLRTAAYESSRDKIRDSETYQRAKSGGKRIGGAVARFTRRVKQTASVARDTWKASKESPATDSEPTNNE